MIKLSDLNPLAVCRPCWYSPLGCVQGWMQLGRVMSDMQPSSTWSRPEREEEEERERERAGQKGGRGGGSDELWIQHLPAHRHILIQGFRASPGLEWFYPLNTVNQIMIWSQMSFNYPENPAAQCTVHRANQASHRQTTSCQKVVVNIVITGMFRGAQQSSGLPKAHMEAINGGQRYKHTMHSMDHCTQGRLSEWAGP